MTQRNDIKILKLIDYFVNNYHYTYVDIKQDKQEVWLTNNDNPEYQAIRITSTPLTIWDNDLARIKSIKEALEKMFGKSYKLLDIHVGMEKVEDDEYEGIKQISIDDDFYSGDNLDSIFKDLRTINLKSDNSPNEMKKLAIRFKEEAAKRIQNQKKKSKPMATYVIGIICIIMFALIHILNMSVKSDTATSIILGSYYKAFVVAGYEFWRFLTVGFIHIDLVHLLCNMISLYSLGVLCENIYGRKNYLIIILGSVVMGSVFVYIGNANIVSVGLSGGLYGLMGATLVYGIHTKVIYEKRVLMNFLWVFMINISISFLPGISLLAHLGGLVCGTILAFIFTNNPDWKTLKKNAIIAFTGFCLVLAYKCATITINDPVTPIYRGTDSIVLDNLEKAGLGWYKDNMLSNLEKVYQRGK